ncbi:uncharacterized protein LACBIDRAFT_302865 [Laccaria bicolor S238N-H82]|uniref:Predicted protein n=1 Tax=Laccaria bicolor (strain S238N-H82 / ATCC MYA-4686) TaxID=486041 RepID=B0DIH4_LACBS|nr:uncharacterized protein LACBIDRAFT_302865 [Laccaria bicolor S238N-H82]EDR05567.1 predicted protein [Laccaria bicolor S238N-H82]|eukprot:XP_001883671.1 predicted protein [Laccaria bicolor S238N-H82]
MGITKNSDHILWEAANLGAAFWALLSRLFIIKDTVNFFCCSWKELWSQRADCRPNTVCFPPPSPPLLANKLTFISFVHRMRAVILCITRTHSPLFLPFFRFSIGCLNVLMGLIFQKLEGTKSKRSVTFWREHTKSALPTQARGVDIHPILNMASVRRPRMCRICGRG